MSRILYNLGIEEWPGEHTNWLKENFGRGSFSFLEKEFARAFPEKPRTRNALIGKSKRLGLKSPKKVSANSRKKKIVQFAPKVYAKRQPQTLNFKPPPVDALRALPDRVTSRYDCAWPNDADPCPSRACIGPYCKDHARLAYREMPSRERIRKLIYE